MLRTVVLLLLLFFKLSGLVANPRKATLQGADAARDLLNRDKRTKRENLAAHPPHPPYAARREEIKSKLNTGRVQQR